MHEPILEGDLVEWLVTGDEGEVIDVNATRASVRFDHGTRNILLDELLVIS